MKKFAYHFSVISFVLSICSSAPAQNPEWINYTNADFVKALADKGNYVWVGSNGGLYQIDITSGARIFYEKSNSSLPGNSVRSIVIDKHGNKWIGSGGGLVV